MFPIILKLNSSVEVNRVVELIFWFKKTLFQTIMVSYIVGLISNIVKELVHFYIVDEREKIERCLIVEVVFKVLNLDSVIRRKLI